MELQHQLLVALQRRQLHLESVYAARSLDQRESDTFTSTNITAQRREVEQKREVSRRERDIEQIKQLPREIFLTVVQVALVLEQAIEQLLKRFVPVKRCRQGQIFCV